MGGAQEHCSQKEMDRINHGRRIWDKFTSCNFRKQGSSNELRLSSHEILHQSHKSWLQNLPLQSEDTVSTLYSPSRNSFHVISPCFVKSEEHLFLKIKISVSCNFLCITLTIMMFVNSYHRDSWSSRSCRILSSIRNSHQQPPEHTS